MTRRKLTYFPHDSGYDFGDAQHLPILAPEIEDEELPQEEKPTDDGHRPPLQPKEKQS